jgi:hypothetical protein
MHVDRLRRFVVQCPKKDVQARRSNLESLGKTVCTPMASIVLAAAVLTAASFLAPFARAATDSYEMPPGTPFDPNPAAPNSPTQQILRYGVDPKEEPIPLKTLRISNNATQTVYPIMRDPNSSITNAKEKPKVGLYDPWDAPLKEYRGYIGYEKDGKYYFGLEPGQSILVSIPLVFWNGARIGVGTDGEYLTATKPNPLRWAPTAKRIITKAETSPDTIPNGVVMWYRADIPEAPNDDTEDQLAEWTVRDHDYLNSAGMTEATYGEIPDNELVTLINYDVSNVDNIYLPLAMAANDVWLVPQETGPNGNRVSWKPGSDPDVYGWTGAANTIDYLQEKIRAFTVGKNQLLGQYFSNNEGWPFYYFPNPTKNPDAPIKIPSGANIFAQSPIKAVPSSYGTGTWETDRYMLSSGGIAPISATIGWAGGTPDPKGSEILHLNLAEPDKIKFLHKGYLVQGRPPPDKLNPIQDGTTVTGVDKTAGTVTLSEPLVASSESCAFTFTRPVNDYASDAMIRLWYSWAQYYRLHWKDNNKDAPASTKIRGSIDEKTAVLKFNIPHPELVEGMAVKGPGLDDAMTEVGLHQGDAVILEIASDELSVILSQVVATGSKNAEFTFLRPQPLLWKPENEGDPGYPLFGNGADKFKFSDEPAWHDPYKFSQQVYLIMASMNQIGEQNNDSVCKYMQDIVGANMGFIFTNEAKDTYDGQMVTSMIRDMIKSVLRGVTDFTEFPDVIDKDGNHTQWYPDPSEAQGGKPFNVFNLDPFVWFVHVVLGFTGYGFSVDDDTADVGAGGASKLQLTVTKTGGLKKTDPWTIQAPFGPVENVSLYYSGPASKDNGDTLFYPIKDASNNPTAPITIKVTTSQLPYYLSEGNTVVIAGVEGNTAANGTFKVGYLTRDSFLLFNAVNGTTPVLSNGTYTEGGTWSYPLHPYIDSGDPKKVFRRVTGDDALGTFLGTSVSVNGVVKNPTKKEAPPFRVWQLGELDKGRLLLWADLTDKDGNLLPAGYYNFTFFGTPIQP